MSGDTNISDKPAVTISGPVTAAASQEADSKFAGVSMRGWLAMIIIATVCGMSAARIEVVEPLYSMGIAALGFYFGQKNK